jgi:hypothetical protein
MGNDWADGSDLARMSRGGNVLPDMGYDPDDVKINPSMRAELMQKLGSPMQQVPVQMAQNMPPPRPGTDPASPANKIDQSYLQHPPPQPAAVPAQPLPSTLPTPQSMAGGPPTSSSVSPSGTSTPAAAPMSWQEQAAQKTVNERLGETLTPPDTTKLDADIASRSVPTNPLGQTYAPTAMQRIGRGVKSAVVGAAVGGIPGAIVGAVEPGKIIGGKDYGAPNSKYGVAESTRKATLAADQKQRQDLIDKFKTMADLQKERNTTLAGVGKTTHESSGDVNVANKLPNETTTANADATRAGADQTRATNEGNPKNEQEALSKAYTTDDPKEAAKYFNMAKAMHAATIEEKPPRAPGEQPSAGLVEFNAFSRARQGETGKPLSSDDVLGFIHRTDPDAPEEVGSIVAQAMDAKQKFADSLTRQPDGTYQDKDAKEYTAQQFQDQIDKIGRSDPNTKLAKKGYTIDATGNLTPTHTSAATPAATPAPGAPKPPRLNEVRKGYRYTGGDPASPTSWAKVRK